MLEKIQIFSFAPQNFPKRCVYKNKPAKRKQGGILMKLKKSLSFVLAMTMATSSCMTAFAADTDIPADASEPAEEQPAAEPSAAEIVEDMIAELEETPDASNSQATDAETTEEVAEDTAASDASDEASQRPHKNPEEMKALRAAARQERLNQRDAKIELACQLRETRLAAKESRIALLNRLKELHTLLEGQEPDDQNELMIELRIIQEQIKAYRQSHK
jgi:hypothetical protein